MGYISVAELRAEGVTNPPFADPRCQTAIDRATALIDLVTGWWFESRARTFLLDGRGHRELHLNVPIISLSKVEVGGEGSWSEIDLTELDIYNRHMSGQTDPDDRFNPRIVRDGYNLDPGYRFNIYESYWPIGTQNIRVTGKFGFTDYAGGTPVEGVTPPLIKLACARLASRELPGAVSDDWTETHVDARVTGERTRDQSISFAKPYTYEHGGWPSGSVLTGDPEVDAILARYRKPIAVKGA